MGGFVGMGLIEWVGSGAITQISVNLGILLTQALGLFLSEFNYWESVTSSGIDANDYF